MRIKWHFICLLLLFPLGAMGQKSLLDKELQVENTRGTVETLLTDISNAGGFTLTYGEDIPVNRRVRLRKHSASTQDLLSDVLGPGFYFIEFGNKILLKKKNTTDESTILRGRVIDRESREALPGVNIYIPGTDPLIGGISDPEGYFRIEVPPEISIIHFSSIGYEPQDIQPGETGERVVELNPDRQEIDEVSIVKLSIPVTRSVNIARAVISEEELGNTRLNTIDEALLGSVSGVHAVRQTGLPGANIAVKVRGIHSLINSEPAYYLNGMQVQKAVLAAIAPNNIGSIEVIKDPTGTAIYGAHGGNGVVILNTRKETEYGFHTDVEYYGGIQNLWKSYDLLTGPEFKDYHETVFPTRSLPPSFDSTRQTNWLNDLFQTGNMQEAHLSLSYKNDEQSMMFNVGYYTHEAMIKDLSLDRYTVGFNAQQNIGNRLRISEEIHLANLVYRGLKEGSFMNDYSNSILGAMVTLPGNDTASSPTGYNSSIPHPSDNIELRGNLKKNQVLLGSLGLEFDLSERMVYKARVGIEVLQQEIVGYTNSPPIFIAGPDFNFYRNEYGIKDLTLDVQQQLKYNFVLPEGQSLSVLAGYEYGRVRSDWLPSLQLFYSSKEAFNAGEEGDTMLYYSSLAYTTDFQQQAAYATLSYERDSKYYIELMLRRDALRFPYNDRLQKPSDWFPSATVGWMFSEEDLFQNLSLLSFGKLRAGIGKAGMSPRLNYSYYAQMTRQLEYLIAFNSARSTGVTNSALLRQTAEQVYWENKTSINIGLDLGLFRNKVFINTDYFIGRLNMGEQYPADNPLAFISELSQRRYYRINYPPNSRILNQGIELEISYKERISNFYSNLGFHIAHLSNKILEVNELPMSFLYDQDFDLISANIPGYPAGSFYGYQIEKLFRAEDCNDHGKAIVQPYIDDGPIRYYAQAQAMEGDYKFADLNQDSILDMQDKTILGNPMPDLTFGFDWKAEYKGFDLSLMIQGSYGNEIFNVTKLWLLNPFGQTNWSREILDSYRRPVYEDDVLVDPGHTDTDLHRFDWLSRNHNLRISDLFIEDGSYLRIKSLQLGYTFKPSRTQGFFVEKLRVYILAKNLYTLTRYSGLDPEIGGWGVDCGIYPQPRSFFAGVRLEF